MNIGLFISIIILIAVGFIFYKSEQKKQRNYIVPANIEQLLYTNVTFFTQLSDADKKLFEARVKDFLSSIAVRGVDVMIDDLDRVLVAAGAIIPIFAFPDWRYNNLSEVLIYKDTFNREYQTSGAERDVLGIVGDGALHREMILSQPALLASFKNPADGHNTAIHEFAHLVDKADGATDGIPEYLLARPYVLPWVTQMHDTIRQMRAQGHSDINLYGATNDAEFFAVVSEYFFERPGELKAHHPELYALLETMFHAKKP